MAWCFGIPYGDLQTGMKDIIASMIAAILILLAVGVLLDFVKKIAKTPKPWRLAF
ncbi:hypothetical protein [Dysosmobacter sp.]